MPCVPCTGTTRGTPYEPTPTFFSPAPLASRAFWPTKSTLTGLTGNDLLTGRGGVLLRASWRDALLLNLHSRLAQRVLVQLAHAPYRNENDLYALASDVAWEIWFTPRQSFKIEVTAQHSPLQSLNFAALRVKDAVADRFRAKTGVRPDVNTRGPTCASTCT